MPFIKCPNCGNKISVPPTPTACANCGGPISMPRPTASSYPPVPVSRPMPPMPTPTSSYPPVPVSRPMPPVPVPAPMPPVPIVSSPSAVSVYGPLPRNMPSRPPDLEGTIPIPPVTHEVKIGTEWSYAVLGCLFFPLLLVLKPFMFATTMFGMMSKPERKMTINTIRVLRSDGKMPNARLEGDLMGAGISLGDEVSLWGHDRSGTLIVQRAYNHTTLSEIQVRPPVAPWIARVFAGMLLMMLGLLLLSILLSVH